MEEFQSKFFPEIARTAQSFAGETDYCKYNNHWLQTATSALYLTALVSTYLASWVTDKYGRKISMLVSGIASLVGAGHCAGAKNLAMLILGRAMMGWGIGFGNQVSRPTHDRVLFFFSWTRIMTSIPYVFLHSSCTCKPP